MLRLLAHGKVNWTLDILGKSADGYHTMDMLMGTVRLADELTIEPAEALSLSIAGNDALPTEDNLVLIAARALQQAAACGKGAHISLVKRLPVGAGMGGGSADAAAALVGLNALWHTGLTREALQTVALAVGADVPFLLSGGFARVGGIGEQITAHHVPDPIWLVVLQPCKPFGTGGVFAAYDRLACVEHPQTETALAAFTKADWPAFSAAAGNVLQQAVEDAHPQIPEAAAALTACGALYAAMTGSGSAVFGAFAGAKEAEAAFCTLRRRWRKCWLTKTYKDGVSFL